jgi:hypothetical protein
MCGVLCLIPNTKEIKERRKERRKEGRKDKERKERKEKEREKISGSSLP